MEETKKKNTKLIAIISAISAAVVTLVIVLIFVFANKGKSTNPIVGKWAYASGSNYTYNFYDNGAGSYGYCSTNNSAEECEKYTSHFTYTLNINKKNESNQEEDKAVEGSIDFLYDGNTTPMTLKFRVEGDKLIIYDSFDEPVEYSRSK